MPAGHDARLEGRILCLFQRSTHWFRSVWRTSMKLNLSKRWCSWLPLKCPASLSSPNNSIQDWALGIDSTKLSILHKEETLAVQFQIPRTILGMNGTPKGTWGIFYFLFFLDMFRYGCSYVYHLTVRVWRSLFTPSGRSGWAALMEIEEATSSSVEGFCPDSILKIIIKHLQPECLCINFS